MKQNVDLSDRGSVSYTTESSGNCRVYELSDQPASTADPEFRKVHDTVLRILMDFHSEPFDKFDQMLTLGMQYLNLDSAVMGSVLGRTLHISSLTGDVAKSNSQGDKLLIAETLFHRALDSDDTLAIHRVKTHYRSEAATRTDTIDCFIGRQINTANGPYGLIGFYSSQPRDKPFSSRNIEVVNLIAQSIGLIMGYEERIEFISHYTESYQPMLSIIPAMMLLCDETGLVVASSHRLSTLFDVKADSIPGTNICQYIHPNDHVNVRTVLKQGDVEHIPITLSWNDDMSLEVELSSCIKSIGTMQGIRIIVLTDVAERNKAIREVEQQNRQLTQANQSLDQFAYIASHDLQEPLRKIQQFSAFLQDDLDGSMTTDTEYHLNVILKASKKMTGLVQDVLQLSRSAQSDPVLSDVNLSELVEDVIDGLELRIEEASARITVSALPTVQGDRGLVQQLFTNLISNSIKYRDHSRHPIIIINAVFEGNTLAIAIRDNGIGFDPDQTKAAFEPFSRLQTSDDYNGNGIGLAICMKVCDRHNWTLTATSTPGLGSVFTIRIPDGAP